MKQFLTVLISVLILVFGLTPAHLSAQNRIPIFLIGTVNYPGAGNSTTPFAINNRGDIVGDYLDAANVRRGFWRHLNGSFATIVAPGDTGNFTRARGINSRQTISGDFYTLADNTFHGYLLQNGAFTQFDIAPLVSTDIFGINDAGNFVGATGSIIQPNMGFVHIGGTTTTFSIPGSFDSQALGINNANLVVGSYRDASFINHGFIRAANGNISSPVDYPGSSSTIFNGVNNRGWVVGSYTDAQGRLHGLFRKNATTYVTYDFPNAVETSFNGINDFGVIVGRYTDGNGIRHGFAALALTF